MAGPDPRDPLSIDAPPDGLRGGLRRATCRGLRVAWSADLGYAAVDPEVRRDRRAPPRVRFADLAARSRRASPAWDNPDECTDHLPVGVSGARQTTARAERPEWIEPTLMRMIERAAA